MVTIFITLLATVTLGTIWLGRKTTGEWQMSLRRERILVEGFASLSEAIASGNRQEASGMVVNVGVRLCDEIYNQQAASWIWPRVPPPGHEWPNFKPAPLRILHLDETDA